jgi:hypothetical protein
MHRAIQNTTCYLNRTRLWPATWDLARESVLVCPQRQWRLSVS